MKRFCRLFSYIAAVTVLTACVDEYQSDFRTDKPNEVAIEEYLNDYDVLKTYIDRTVNPNFKLGTGVPVSDFLKKESIYSMVSTNFDEVTPMGNELTHGAIVGEAGIEDYTILSNFALTASDAEVCAFGPALCRHTQQNHEYLNSLIAAIIIPGEKGTIMVSDFESDDLGKTYPMSGNGSATVVDDPKGVKGKVLHIGGPANQSFPIFRVKLPDGKTLGDCKSVVIDFNAPGSGGLYGSGMRMRVVGKGSEGKWGQPSSFGCKDGQWANGLIELEFEKLSLSNDDKLLTEFEFQIGSGTGSGNYYIDNVRIKWEIIGQTVEKTPAEKEEIIGGALDKWISGMIQAASGDIKSWDVISEAMSDDEGQMLRSATNEANPEANFYWSDYMGDNFARTVVNSVRKHFKENEGNEAELKLFVNEYGLEKPGNGKCKRLIDMIDQWEQDGVTKIDGIGTQMHLTYSLDPAKQKQSEESIIEMFKLLAATGKLIRISELDMTLVNTNGEIIKPSNITFSQQLSMSEYYNFAILKYFEVIPVAQRYGISHANTVENSSNCVGLWNKNWSRKPTYIGFADGLAGKKSIIENN